MKTPKNRPPTTPGEVIREEYLAPLEMTQGQLAEHLGVRTETVNRILTGKSALSVGMALRLAKAFGTTPELWMNLQLACDLWAERRKLDSELKAIKKIA